MQLRSECKAIRAELSRASSGGRAGLVLTCTRRAGRCEGEGPRAVALAAAAGSASLSLNAPSPETNAHRHPGPGSALPGPSPPPPSTPHSQHTHEVPVTSEPITIVHMDEDVVVVNKPASIPPESLTGSVGPVGLGEGAARWELKSVTT
ncbi:Uncharacterized protein GBIM_10300 [Gryllus bimaculatus]|nr:Uncharacterized protein GBIM_10300 [Gryllus bimaculatus]